ncbi:MAG: hypothetical protein QXJ62_02410 [Nitrososphaeria archaeon]
MNSNSIVQDQIYFLRLLIRYDSAIWVSLTGRRKWLDLFNVIQNRPISPIASRSILKNEIVLELDNASWESVRDGTKEIIPLLEKWGAKDCYYLSFFGNRSIHVHVFFDQYSLKIKDNVQEILEGIDKDKIKKSQNLFDASNFVRN